MVVSPTNVVLGLSPRVRGNPRIEARPVRVGGSIPACAGEPGGADHSPDVAGVYPRVCGGTVLEDTDGSEPKGLSPRVRGNPIPPAHHAAPGGSIPACAGEPTASSRSHPVREVYPRVCGGTVVMPVQHDGTRGLSPRVRGNRSFRMFR